MRRSIGFFIASLLSVSTTVVCVVGNMKKFRPHPYLSNQPSEKIEIVFSAQMEHRHTETTYTGWINREMCGSMLPEDAVCHSTTTTELDKLYDDTTLTQGVSTPNAVVVSVYNHNLSTIEAWKSKGVEVFYCVVESITYFPNVKLFEGNATAITYRLNTADIPYLYTPEWPFHPNQTSEIRTPVFEEPGLSHIIRGAAILASNCYSTNNREEYSRYFIEHYPTSTQVNDSSMFTFDSLGNCMKTVPWPTQAHNETIEAIRKYMFYFAFENSCTVDYVTEKVYNGLAAGVIPVYLGAPNVEEFVPPNSIIDASKFESLPELAEYLEKVSRNETLYRSYFQWKYNTTGLAAVYQKLKPYIESPYYCRMCLYAYGRTRLGYDKQWWNRELQRWQAPPIAHSKSLARRFWKSIASRLKLEGIVKKN